MVYACVEHSDEHTRGIAPRTHEIITLGAHYFPADSGKNDNCTKFKPPKASKSVGTRSTRLGKREKPGGEKPPPAKKPRLNFKVGDIMAKCDICKT